MVLTAPMTSKATAVRPSGVVVRRRYAQHTAARVGRPLARLSQTTVCDTSERHHGPEHEPAVAAAGRVPPPAPTRHRGRLNTCLDI